MSLTVLMSCLLLSFLGSARSSTTIPASNDGWCSHAGATIKAGDFDGDGHSDVLCHDTTGRYWARYAAVFKQDEYFASMLGQCSTAPKYIGDFNGDGRDDLLCHTATGAFSIAPADVNGKFSSFSWVSPTLWCSSVHKFHVGDFNGDGITDLLCHRIIDGYKWVAIAVGGSSYFAPVLTSWHTNMLWCYHSGALLFVGDFNGDGKDDILCHDGAGQKWIAYANPQGASCAFTGFTQGYYRNMGWCYHGGSDLRIAYLNDDKLADLVCHDNAGSTWIAVNDPVNRFDIPHTGSFAFCAGAVNRFLVRNFLENRKDEFLCTVTSSWSILKDVA